MTWQENRQKRILVVDDTPEHVKLLSRMLFKQGYEMCSTFLGSEALHVLHHFKADLILLDISLPDMSGFEVCRHLKATEATRDIPVIFISVRDEVSDKVKAFEAGGVDYITKPFRGEEVLVRVSTHLALRTAYQQLEEQKNILQREMNERKAAEEALQRAHEELEQRVAERTTELLDMNRASRSFVPQEFLSLLNKESITAAKLGDQIQRTMTVMFSDIRSFTTLTEHMTPQESFNFINEYLSHVSPVIRHHHGLVDKYIGDAIMALFPEQADHALQAAIAMHAAINRYNRKQQEQGKTPIAIGIGLHTGCVMLGIIGEENRKQVTVIADAVNLASRVERLTSLYGASIIVSEHVLFNLKRPSQYQFRFLDKVKVKGKQEPVSVFEILDGIPADIQEMRLKTRTDFEKGLLYYHNEEFREACTYFQRILEVDSQDRAAQLYMQRASYFLEHGVPHFWDGVEILTEK
jgi:two-component system sensor histidine kinase ChiS